MSAIASALAHRGLLELARGNPFDALEPLRGGREAMEAIGRKGFAAVLRSREGMVRAMQGDLAGALEIDEQSLRVLTRLGDRANAAAVLSDLANLYAVLGRDEEAVALLRQTRDEMEACGDPGGAAHALHTEALVRMGHGEPESVLALLQEVAARHEAMSNPREVAVCLEDQARVYRELGKPGEGRAALEKAVAIHRRNLALDDLARALGSLGTLLDATGEEAQGRERLDEALEVARRTGNRTLVADLEDALAGASLRRGAYRETMDHARRSLRIRESMGRGLGEAGIGLREPVRRAADRGALAALELWKATRQGPSGKALATSPGGATLPGDRSACVRDAFSFVERGRARILAEGLLHRRAILASRVPQDLLEAEGRARDEVERARRDLLAMVTAGSASAEELETRRDTLDRAYDRLEQAFARCERAARRTGSLGSPPIVDLESLRAILPADERLLLYQLAEGRLFAVVVGPDGGDLVDLGPSGSLDEDAARYRSLVATSASQDVPLAAALYEKILGPVEPLLAGARRLVISPDGVLAFLPFEALVLPGEDRTGRAVDRWEIVYVPSASIHATLRRESPPEGVGFLGLGDPTPPSPPHEENPVLLAASREAGSRIRGLPPLPSSAVEVAAIASMFPEGHRKTLLREEATLASLRSTLETLRPRRLRAIHFACHGIVDAARPRLTGLVLSQGDVLDLDVLYGLEIPADLVVLSACETARGARWRGEGVLGLARGFFLAGAPRVVVSDWAVADEEVQGFMADFYRAMLQEGRSAAAALRQVKLARQRRGEHPSSWAAFVLWGLPEG